ncbi:hypothetical protein HK097_001997, partial [Rhizophlyctis rosea]
MRGLRGLERRFRRVSKENLDDGKPRASVASPTNANENAPSSIPTNGGRDAPIAVQAQKEDADVPNTDGRLCGSKASTSSPDLLDAQVESDSEDEEEELVDHGVVMARNARKDVGKVENGHGQEGKEKKSAKEKDVPEEKKRTVPEQEEGNEDDHEAVIGKLQNWTSSKRLTSLNAVNDYSAWHENDDERKPERKGTKLSPPSDAPKPLILEMKTANAGAVDDDNAMDLELEEEEEVLEPLDIDDLPGTVDEERDGEGTKLKEVIGEVKMVSKQTSEPFNLSADDLDNEVVGGNNNEDAPPA